MLSDEQKRSLYDQYGEAGVKSTVGGSGAYTVCSYQLFVFLIFHVSFSFESCAVSGHSIFSVLVPDISYDVRLKTSYF